MIQPMSVTAMKIPNGIRTITGLFPGCFVGGDLSGSDSVQGLLVGTFQRGEVIFTDPPHMPLILPRFQL